MGIYSRYKGQFGEEVEALPVPVQNTDNPYATEAAMHADQANQLEGYGYLVDGVGAFTYLGTVAGTAADYEPFGGGLFTAITENQYGTHPAFNSQNSLNAYLLGGTTPAPTQLNAPTGMIATASSGDAININWNDTNS